MSEYATLLSPVSIGPVPVRNRVVSSSHQTSLVHDHLPTDDLLAYHRERARGGVGAIFIEATAVHPTGLLTAHTIGGYLPEVVPAYRRLTDAVHGEGAGMFVQLFHGGRELIASSPKPPAVAPSAVPSLRFKSEPRALTVREISELIDGYAVSARHAADGGLDGVEISMAHGYLPAQFFSALSNHRTDRYGLSARTRFAIEVLTAIREAAPAGLSVGVRLSGDELVPGGLRLDDCAEIAGELHRAGLIDFVSLALGHSAFPRGSTWIAPPPPTPLNAIADPAATFRGALPELTLIATTRVVDLDDAERLVAAGVCDLVGMTRALIADPELIAKTTAGRAETVIECVGCNQACIGHYHAGVPIGCAVNPRTGRERTLPRCGIAPRRATSASDRRRTRRRRRRARGRGRRRRRHARRTRARDRRAAASRRARAGPPRAMGALPPFDLGPAAYRGGRGGDVGRRRGGDGGGLRRRRARGRGTSVHPAVADHPGPRGTRRVVRDPNARRGRRTRAGG